MNLVITLDDIIFLIALSMLIFWIIVYLIAYICGKIQEFFHNKCVKEVEKDEK